MTLAANWERNFLDGVRECAIGLGIDYLFGLRAMLASKAPAKLRIPPEDVATIRRAIIAEIHRLEIAAKKPAET